MASNKEKRVPGEGWVGEEELTRALKALEGQQLSDVNTTALVKKATQTALKFQAEYKMVVFEVEKYIKRASASDKLAGISIIDSLCRHTHGKDKDVFCSRFATRMSQICACLNDLPPSDRITFGRILDDWRRKKMFPANILPEGDGGVSSSTPSSSSSHAPQSTSSTSVGADDTSTVALQQAIPAQKRKAAERKIKICPFREGNCPFGEKCRFEHDQNAAWSDNVTRKTKKPPFQGSTPEERVFGSEEKRPLPSTKELVTPGFALASYPAELKQGNVDTPSVKRFARSKISCEAPLAGSTSLHVTSKDSWSSFPVRQDK
jgi:CID domain/CCCH-type zinc finger